MPRVALRLLGAPGFAVDGEAIPVTAARTVPVFALLASVGGRVPRERLTELLWRRAPPASRLASLRQLVHHFPEALRGTLVSERQTLELDREAVDCDLWDLRAALASAGRARDLLRIYAGPLLGVARYDDFPEFDDWLRSERVRLAGDVRGGIEREIATLAPDAAVELARGWLQVEPLDEEMHARVMSLHIAAGRTQAAEAQFEELRRRLAGADGRVPQPATRALLDAAMRRRGAPRGSMPMVATSFVGRQDELAGLARLAADPGCRLVTLHGPGGVGKTRLAMAFAEQHARSHDPAVFVSLESAHTAQALYAAIAAALGLELAPRKDPRLAVCEAMRAHRGLLVLDNFEQLLPARGGGTEKTASGAGGDTATSSAGTDTATSARVTDTAISSRVMDTAASGSGAAQAISGGDVKAATGERAAEAPSFVVELLREAPHLAVLVTSRVSLGVPEERLVPVAGLPYPRADRPDGDHDAGVELFVSRARQAYRGFSARAEHPHVLAICRAAEGLPLALELAAAQVGTRPCADIARDLLEPASLPRAVNRPDRQSSVLRVVEQSLAAASPAQAEAFTRLALFQGAFPAERAFAVARVAEGELADLAGRALLARDARGFRMHPLLRQVALRRLQRRPALCRRVESQFVADTVRRAVIERDRLYGPGSREAHARIPEHRDDDMVALHLAAAHGLEEETWDLASAVVDAALATGLVRAAQEAWPEVDAPGRSGRLRAILLVRRGELRRHAGDFDASVADYEAALALTDDERVHFQGHAGRAGLQVFRGGYAQCVGHCERALALGAAAADEAGKVRVMALLGTALAELGEHARARTVLEEAVARAEAIEASAFLLVHPLNALGGLAEYTGDSHACAAIHRRALAMLEADGLYRTQAPHWCNLGGALLGVDDFAGALPAFEKAIEIASTTGDAGPLTYSQVGLANVLAGLGRFTDAERVAAEAQATSRRIRSSALLSEATTARARAALGRGDPGAARAIVLEHRSTPTERDSGFRHVDEVVVMLELVEALDVPDRGETIARAYATVVAHPACRPGQRAALQAWAARHDVRAAPSGDLDAVDAELLALLE